MVTVIAALVYHFAEEFLYFQNHSILGIASNANGTPHLQFFKFACFTEFEKWLVGELPQTPFCQKYICWFWFSSLSNFSVLFFPFSRARFMYHIYDIYYI